MLEKLKKLFPNKDSPYIGKLKSLGRRNLNLYEREISPTILDFINSDIVTSIQELTDIVNNSRIYVDLIKVKPINNTTLRKKSLREWLTDDGCIVFDLSSTLKSWIKISIAFIKLHDKLLKNNGTIALKNYRLIRPYRNEIEIITDFMLDNV